MPSRYHKKTLSAWMLKNYRKLSAEIPGYNADWEAIIADAANDGASYTSRGIKPTVAVARQTWHRVKAKRSGARCFPIKVVQITERPPSIFKRAVNVPDVSDIGKV